MDAQSRNPYRSIKIIIEIIVQGGDGALQPDRVTVSELITPEITSI